MSRDTAKLLTTRADAAKAAMAARDANVARETLERALTDLHSLADAVELLNQRLAGLSGERADVTAQVVHLTSQVEELGKVVKKAAKAK